MNVKSKLLEWRFYIISNKTRTLVLKLKTMHFQLFQIWKSTKVNLNFDFLLIKVFALKPFSFFPFLSYKVELIWALSPSFEKEKYSSTVYNIALYIGELQ